MALKMPATLSERAYYICTDCGAQIDWDEARLIVRLANCPEREETHRDCLPIVTDRLLAAYGFARAN